MIVLLDHIREELGSWDRRRGQSSLWNTFLVLDRRLCAFASNLSPQTKSTGRWIFTPFSLALSINSPTILAFRVEEAFTDFHPFKHLLKGEGHPTSDDNFVGPIEEVSNEGNLVGHLGSPEDGSTGRFGFSRTDPKASSSFCMRNPATLSGKSTPTTDECARWAVPKASFT